MLSAPSASPATVAVRPDHLPARRRHLRAVRRVRAPKVDVVRPAPSLLERRAGLALILVFALLSGGGHVVLFDFAVRMGLIARKAVKAPPSKIEVAVVEKKVEPPPPPPEPPPEPPKPLVKSVPKPLVPPPVAAPPPPPDVQPAPPPPNQEAATPTPAVPIVGISLSSTSSAGSFAMNVGNTAYGEVKRVATAPSDVKPYKAERYAPSYQLAEAPVFLNNLSEAEMERFYPPDARRDEVEDQVVVKLTVDDDGSVVAVKVVDWIHKTYAFGEAAKKLAKLYRFKPAKLDGQAVATEITFTIRWELPY